MQEEQWISFIAPEIISRWFLLKLGDNFIATSPPGHKFSINAFLTKKILSTEMMIRV